MIADLANGMMAKGLRFESWETSSGEVVEMYFESSLRRCPTQNETMGRRVGIPTWTQVAGNVKYNTVEAWLEEVWWEDEEWLEFVDPEGELKVWAAHWASLRDDSDDDDERRRYQRSRVPRR